MGRVTKSKGIIVIVDYDLPRNKLFEFLTYHLIDLFEPVHYKNFIKSDLERILKGYGIEAIEKKIVLHGIGKILKGINNKL